MNEVFSTEEVKYVAWNDEIKGMQTK